MGRVEALSGKSRQRRERLFSQGLEALEALGVNTEDEYVCPLCVHGFRRADIQALTLEHVPPRSLGGNPLVLTCRRCNQSAGGPDGVDTHARHLEHRLDLLRGTMPKHLPVDFEVNGQSVIACLRHTKESGMEILGLSSPPGSRERLESELRQVTPGATPMKLRLRGLPFDFEKHKVSWLRASYLVGFAALGYAYVLRPALAAVRQKIRDPSGVSLAGFHSWDPSGRPGLNKLALGECSGVGEGLLTVFGQHRVLLPLYAEANDFYALAGTLRSDGEFEFRGRVLPWPSPPRMHWDFGTPTEQ